MITDGFTAWCACERAEHPGPATELAIAITAIATGQTHECQCAEKETSCLTRSRGKPKQPALTPATP